MKLFIICILLFSCVLSKGQIVSGTILDSSNNQPIEFASVGVINTPIGTITDPNGQFKINITGQSPEALVRISIISYKEEVYTLDQFAKLKTIKLDPITIKLQEVVVRPGKISKAGTKKYTCIGNWCGWGGTQFGKGWEKGTIINLGPSPVQVTKFHIHLQRQAFDSSFFRLHIRNIANGFPKDEILNHNIIFSITKERGWIDVDLRKYNIIAQGEVAVTIEWVKVNKAIPKRAMKFNGGLQREYILFNTKANESPSLEKRGSENRWIRQEKLRPAIYLTVM